MRVQLCLFSKHFLKTLMLFHLPFPEGWAFGWISASPGTPAWTVVKRSLPRGLSPHVQDIPAPYTTPGDIWARAVPGFHMEWRLSDAAPRGLRDCVPHTRTGQRAVAGAAVVRRGSPTNCSSDGRQKRRTRVGISRAQF